MTDLEPNVISTEELATSPTTLSKPLSWPRNARTSCDSCKQMKIKCQRNDQESCARCVARKLNCTTTPVERKRQKTTNKRGAYFDEMEDRIKRMESAVITSQLQGIVEPAEGNEEDRSSSDKIESQARLSNHLSNLVVDPSGSSSFIGWASGFSLLSPQGLRWISEKVGDKNELAQLVRKMSKDNYGVWGSADVDLWYPMPRSQHTPLPSKDLALRYVDCFFTTFNNVLPVVNQRGFNSFFERQHSTNPPANTAWYALYNAVLCLGSIRTQAEHERHTRNSYLIDYTSISQETGAKYFRNASSCFHDLFFKEANLMAMQAMTLMLFITTTSPNPQPAYALTSAAGNLANTLGLHRKLDGFGVAPEEIEQRRDVFWVFYLLEKAVSHNLGRPSVISDDEIAIDLPPKDPVLIESPSGMKIYDLFQDQITLAIIGSRICSELYSANSQTKSQVGRLKILDKLDNNLQRWRDSMPVDIRPEHPINCSSEQYINVIMVHFKYLDAVILLHRLAGHHGSVKDGEATDEKSQDQRPLLHARLRASQMLCLAAARRSIHLLDAISTKNLHNQHLTWMTLYYPLSASLILFANTLSNPRDQHAAADIDLMNLITSFITRFVQPGTPFANTPTLSLFKELYGISRRFVARAASKSSQKLTKLPGSDGPPYNLATKHSRTNIPASTLSSANGSQQQVSQGNQDLQSVTSTRTSQESTSDSGIEFAPFIPPESSQFDFDPTISDSLLSPTRSEWNMTNMWIPNFDPDQWALAYLIDLPADDNIDYDYGYFDENDDVNNADQE